MIHSIVDCLLLILFLFLILLIDHLLQPSELSLRPTPQSRTFQSFKPIITPTMNPTARPSFHPFVNTGSPHVILSTTAIPSINTILKKEEPTLVPSSIPSVQFPTITTGFETRVTSKPTTVSDIITLHPSTTPTYVPSQSQSIKPTEIPSFTPSMQDSMYPSVKPTSFISSYPSLNPSIGPSVDPSYDPSAVPSMVLSEKPTILPTPNPSLYPSIGPSVAPSVIPTISDNPSINPTVAPTVYPTVAPTIVLSVKPTISDSHRPSFNPSILPSTNISAWPSVIRSMEPTMVSSEKPTEFDTFHPSLNRSMSPSMDPTLKQKQRPPANFPVDNKPTFQSKSNNSSNAPSIDDDNERSTSGAMLIGGISAGVGFFGLLTLAALVFRQWRSEDSMVNTLGSEGSMPSLLQSSHLPAILDSATSRAHETFSTGNSDHNHNDNTEGNVNAKDMNVCNFSYSEDSM